MRKFANLNLWADALGLIAIGLTTVAMLYAMAPEDEPPLASLYSAGCYGSYGAGAVKCGPIEQ